MFVDEQPEAGLSEQCPAALLLLKVGYVAREHHVVIPDGWIVSDMQ